MIKAIKYPIYNLTKRKTADILGGFVILCICATQARCYIFRTNKKIEQATQSAAVLP